MIVHLLNLLLCCFLRCAVCATGYATGSFPSYMDVSGSVLQSMEFRGNKLTGEFPCLSGPLYLFLTLTIFLLYNRSDS